MFIEYDSENKVVYLKLKEGKVAKTVEYREELFLDLDKSGRLLGIELLDLKDAQYLSEIAKKFSQPLLRKVHLGYLPQVCA